MIENKERNLHIGGKKIDSNWEIFNIVPGPEVDHVGNAKDLSRFPDETFNRVYSSHTLEHFDYVRELVQTLKEWKRVLKTKGKLYISVPDLEVLSKLFLEKEKLSIQERFQVVRMMFGGHVDEYDFHQVGFDFELLCQFLGQAGFKTVQRVKVFGLFQDTSGMVFKDQLISLNVIVSN